MSEHRNVRLDDSPITHLVTWSDDVGGYVRCGIDFSWSPDDYRTNARRPVADTVEDDCDCMTCLVGGYDRRINFQSYQDVGVSIINVESISKLKLFDEE